MSLTISTEHYDRVNSFRTDEVMDHLSARPEKLYPPLRRFTPDVGEIIVIKGNVPPEKNRFNNVLDALESVKRWCG